MLSVTLNANAKINLFLDITGKFPNGYHELRTVMQSISLADKVTVALRKNIGIKYRNLITVRTNRFDLPTNRENTAYKAALEFFAKFLMEKDRKSFPFETEIFIEKHIPSSAGLGGGSADAAAVLTALNALVSQEHIRHYIFPECPNIGIINEKTLFELAGKIGADVPFCLRGGTAVCTGIGEKINHCDIPPEIYGKTVMIFKPHFSFSTSNAYKMFDSKFLVNNTEIYKKNVNHGELWYNIFEDVYDDMRISSLKNMFIESGAEHTLMTGSGSAVYGIFSHNQAAEKASERFKMKYKGEVFLCKLEDRGII